MPPISRSKKNQISLPIEPTTIQCYSYYNDKTTTMHIMAAVLDVSGGALIDVSDVFVTGGPAGVESSRPIHPLEGVSPEEVPLGLCGEAGREGRQHELR